LTPKELCVAVPPRHLDDITAVRPSPFIGKQYVPGHYRVDPPERTPPAHRRTPLWLDFTTELIRSVVYTAGAVLGLAIGLTALDYITHWW
jgi:hypothetical protein